MGKYRRDRINEEMAKELCEIVRQIKDPRISRYFVTILRTDVTPDLKYAKIYYSVMGAKDEEIDYKELKAGLKSASGFIRGQIAERLNLRITPELVFLYDDSIAYGAKINALLHTEGVKADIRRFDERMAEEEALAQKENAQQTTDEEDEFDD